MRPGLTRQQITFASKCARTLWRVVWLLLYRPSPTLLHGWRAFLLRLFGAKLGASGPCLSELPGLGAVELTMGDQSTLAEDVDCYCVDKVTIGTCCTVSQYSYLCTAGHDYEDPAILTHPYMPLIAGPITIGDRVWITADVYVGPGVTIGDGAVVLARSSVFHDIPAWKVAAGTPAKVIRERTLRDAKDAAVSG